MISELYQQNEVLQAGQEQEEALEQEPSCFRFQRQVRRPPVEGSGTEQLWLNFWWVWIHFPPFFPKTLQRVLDEGMKINNKKKKNDKKLAVIQV